MTMGSLRIRWYVAALCGVVLALLAWPLESACSESADMQTITGTVYVYEKDDEGAVTSVSIADEDWGDVVVSNKGRGAELLGHVYDTVTARGYITDSEDGEHTIEVVDYTVQESDSDDEDYEDEEDDPDFS